MSNKFLKGSISGILQHVFTACLTFFSIPIFISELGIEQYGVYSLLTVLGNLNVIANLGLNTTLVKSLSSQGKSRQSDHDIIVTVCFVIAISLPITLIALLTDRFVLTSLLGISMATYNSALILYKCILLANLALLLGQTLVAVLDSTGRVYLSNTFQFIYNCIYWIGTIITVKMGYELVGVGIVAVSAAVIWLLFLVYYVSRYWGNVSKIGLSENFRPTLKKQLSHGVKIFSGGILSIMIEPLSKILTGHLIGIKEVGYLEIAYKLRTQIWGFILKAVYPIFPIISSGNSPLSSKNLLLGAQRNLLLFIIPASFTIDYCFPFLLRTWLGSSTSDMLIQTVIVIVIAYLISSIAIPAYFAQLAFLPTSIIYGHIAYLATNILVSVGLYNQFGYEAIVWGNSLGIIFAFLINIYVINVKALKEVPGAKIILRYTACVAIFTFVDLQIVRVSPVNSLSSCLIFGLLQLVIATASYSTLKLIDLNVVGTGIKKQLRKTHE
jgi:O-antigen/teichoic acid export membrane protein